MPQVATAGQQEDLGCLALETWVDDMLKSNQSAQASRKQEQVSPQIQQQAGSASCKGAAAVGLARQQLLASGMSNAAVDQLYRNLFVYSVGFSDTIKVSLLALVLAQQQLSRRRHLEQAPIRSLICQAHVLTKTSSTSLLKGNPTKHGLSFPAALHQQGALNYSSDHRSTEVWCLFACDATVSKKGLRMLEVAAVHCDVYVITLRLFTRALF